MSTNETIPAEACKPCNCCGRIHRKLYNIDGYWMGKTCSEQYKIYRRIDGKNVNSMIWKGYEKQFANVQRMVNR